MQERIETLTWLLCIPAYAGMVTLGMKQEILKYARYIKKILQKILGRHKKQLAIFMTDIAFFLDCRFPPRSARGSSQ